jgi:hypothetical protein
MRYPFVDSNGELVIPPDPKVHPTKQYFLEHALEFRSVPKQSSKSDGALSHVIAAASWSVR